MEKKVSARKKVNLTKSIETYNELLDAAHELLLEGGADLISIRGLGKKSGYGIGTIYLYFNDQNAIYEALLRRQVLNMTRVVQDQLLPRMPMPVEELVKTTLLAILKDPNTKHYIELISLLPAIQGQQTGANLLKVMVDPISAHLKKIFQLKKSQTEIVQKTILLVLAVRGFLAVDRAKLSKSYPEASIFQQEEMFVDWLTKFVLNFIQSELAT